MIFTAKICLTSSDLYLINQKIQLLKKKKKKIIYCNSFHEKYNKNLKINSVGNKVIKPIDIPEVQILKT